MASTSLRFKDRLDGASNLLSWKVRVTLLLEENDLWDIAKDVVAEPTNLQQLAAQKKEVKAKHMIMDAIKDHLIPYISKKKTAMKMFVALVNRKTILQNKLRSIEITISDSVTSYLMRVTQIRDQLATIGEKIADPELVNMALARFPASWQPFVEGICAHENLTNFERLWGDYPRGDLDGIKEASPIWSNK
jgi:hypothetical protein